MFLALALIAFNASEAAISLSIGGSYTGAAAEPANWDYLYSNQASGGTEFALAPNTLVGDGPDGTRQTGFGGPAASKDPNWKVAAAGLGANTQPGPLTYVNGNRGGPGGTGGSRGPVQTGSRD